MKLEEALSAARSRIEAGGDPLDGLHADLVPHVIETPQLGRIIRHPLIVDVFPMAEIVNLQYEHKLAYYRGKVDAEDWSGALALIERPYRMSTLYDWYYGGQVNDAELCDLLPWVWRDSEGSSYVAAEMLELLELTGFLTDAERLPVELTVPTDGRVEVWRGATYAFRRGISWTLDRERAAWFARRFNEGAVVWRATVRREAILAYFNGRSEHEVIVDPARLRVRRATQSDEPEAQA